MKWLCSKYNTIRGDILVMYYLGAWHFLLIDMGLFGTSIIVYDNDFVNFFFSISSCLALPFCACSFLSLAPPLGPYSPVALPLLGNHGNRRTKPLASD